MVGAHHQQVFALAPVNWANPAPVELNDAHARALFIISGSVRDRSSLRCRSDVGIGRLHEAGEVQVSVQVGRRDRLARARGFSVDVGEQRRGGQRLGALGRRFVYTR